MKSARGCRGFTLVELLVVSALFLLFFSLIITAARPNPASQVRQLTQELASAVLAAQTQAMTTESAAGLLITTDGIGSATGIFFSPALPRITGSMAFVPVDLTLTGSISGTFFPNNANFTDLLAQTTGRPFAGRLVRSYASGTTGAVISPWLVFRSGSSGTTANGVPFATGTLTLNGSLTQTINNCVLPSGTMGFALKRFPVAGMSAVIMPSRATVDLRYSGVGSGTAANSFVSSETVPNSVYLGFDRSGCLDTVMTQRGSSDPVVLSPGPVYLLVATATSAATAADASLASPISRWLMIAPTTGRVTVATNVPVSGTGSLSIFNARSNARQASTQGAR